MLKKEITYKDLDDNDITETFWFHLSKAEMAEMALAKEGSDDGGFDAWIRRIINAKQGQVIVDTFKQILLATIGERSEDNKRFIKSEEIRQNFLNSDAYSVLFMELVTDSDKMTEFINGIVPSNMKDEVAKKISGGPDLPTLQGPQARVEEKQTVTAPVVEAPKDDRPDWIKDPNRVPTESELRGATPEQMMEAFRRKSAGAGPVKQEEITGS